MVLELVVLVIFVTILCGGKQKRESGWKVLCGGLVLVAGVQATSCGLVRGVAGDMRFGEWTVGSSWVLSMVGVGLQVLEAGGIVGCALLLPPEGGYEVFNY